jgi:hypothetical protein
LLTALIDALIVRQQIRRQHLDLLRDAFTAPIPTATANRTPLATDASQSRNEPARGAKS